MLTNDEIVALIQKATISTALGGQQSAQDVDRFISMSIDLSAVLKSIRTETGIVTSRNLHDISLGEPCMVAATEATAPGADDMTTPTLGVNALTPVEVLSAYDVSFDFLRKNVEGQSVNQTLNREFAIRWAKDSVLVAFNGDTTLPATTRTNKCRRIFNGFVKLAENNATVHDVQVAGTDYVGTIFPNLLAAMPQEYKEDRAALGLYVSADVAEAYAQQIGARITAFGDQVLTNIVYPPFRGIALYPVFGMADTDMILSPRQNLVVGWGNQMTVGTDINYRVRMIYYTIIGAMDAKIVRGDALVLGKA